MKALIPKLVTVGGEFKSWGFIDGVSSGTSLSVQYEVPPEMTSLELDLAISVSRYQLDVLCINAESIKGTVAPEVVESISRRAHEAMRTRVGDLKRRIADAAAGKTPASVQKEADVPAAKPAAKMPVSDEPSEPSDHIDDLAGL